MLLLTSTISNNVERGDIKTIAADEGFRKGYKTIASATNIFIAHILPI